MKQVAIFDSFQWAKNLIPILKQFESDGVCFYQVAASHADVRNRNGRIYTGKELQNSAASLSERPLNINHDDSKMLPFPENQVLAARYENGVVECIIQIAEPEIQKQIESGEISHVSIEGLYFDESKNTTDTEYPSSLHFRALALLTREDEPGDPDARILKDHRKILFVKGVIKEKLTFVKEAQVVTFQTSGDANVCEICAAMDGNTYPLDSVPDDAQPPIHPNCACSLVGSDSTVQDGRLVKIKKVKMKMNEKNNSEAVWSNSFQNDLPDSSFAFIEPGGKKDEQNKTTPRSLRHFPYRDANGKIDAAHVRNGLARLSQSVISPQGKSAARKELVAAAKQVGIETSMDSAVSALRLALDNYHIAREAFFSALD
ncbi:MAG: phage minor head protein, partial [Nitrososphaerales archaeon]